MIVKRSLAAALIASTGWTACLDVDSLQGGAPRSAPDSAAPSTAACKKTELAVSEASGAEGGFSWAIFGSFGTKADTNDAPQASTLRLFENDRELGPAHALHDDIRKIGLGRFSHFSSPDGSDESLRFSTSDNTDPQRNGRRYTMCVGAP